MARQRSTFCWRAVGGPLFEMSPFYVNSQIDTISVSHFWGRVPIKSVADAYQRTSFSLGLSTSLKQQQQQQANIPFQ